MINELYMNRCFELAIKGIGSVAPNPMVGAVIVHNNVIIGEGYHQKFGQAHAEVNAVRNAIDNGYESFLADSTIYVNLEPCSHFGKTPPCADLLIECQFKKVVVSNYDPFPEVSGNGIKKIREAGIDVATGILESEGREINKRFFKFHEKKRPYTILKYAQSSDGFIAPPDSTPENRKISNELSNKLVHQWRSEEQAILVGTNTALIDNPLLTVRNFVGKNPIRMVIDQDCILPKTNLIFNDEAKTFIFNQKKNENQGNNEFIQIDFSNEILNQINGILYERQISSVLVEGGSNLHQQYINLNLWDEFRVITAPIQLGNGIRASDFEGMLIDESKLGSDTIKCYKPITQ
ncbi:MAG: bifunctional diaminohydroxyphosphoribosylaminopyrimidine deaminase/5-amino-6-(5-phosphoribosylamino)uracil reductase RibD [Bacteroidetes bacterium]|nr:bifunctional diaminohydroxyphosphoribosylaminopyrimidine deaminase/5-amino-6-(5-phosphoribosylamino)uracil reductase RibD [Bacteroidota bacterium]